MNWIRRVSQCNRVRIGFALMAIITAALGGSAAWLLQAQAGLQSAAWAMGVAGASACVFALVSGWAISHSIKAPVEDTVQAVIRVAGGDLETRIESPGKDEISWLRHELNSMRKKLRTAVLEVRTTVDAVNSASEEIARGNTDLSRRTESQASALEQTSSSMHQLAETVRSNAKNTGEARDVVSVSSEVAQRGARIMQDVIERMEQINQSAGRISEIIGVIDGIAFQTNILALNAAVESARAGEHGRGFAVVASEVRALAQRSSMAAREIKALIVDSTDKVSAGSKLVDQAGSTMGDILDSVKRVSALMDEIARAGQAQSEGIGRMHQAIAQMDTVTHQNAALVEQVAAAALSLKGQAGRLSGAMGSFRLAA
ncbi:methyl-accepting chemotaxis protein [Piscinibacter sp. XHJ-5]|uniref:methyl-accepting chemotaxis protein n=1 Tax=Piscinibacter sp. XHJ-5 TaxID=3037797 RepID=UPI0024533A57|nr:methyl-accepting chemotaxis protein [Piscinibacter sp. XHJ-5]